MTVDWTVENVKMNLPSGRLQYGDITGPDI